MADNKDDDASNGDTSLRKRTCKVSLKFARTLWRRSGDHICSATSSKFPVSHQSDIMKPFTNDIAACVIRVPNTQLHHRLHQ
jgi:hypothetical protein